MAKGASLLENRVATYREALGLTQAQLARAIEVSRQTIVAIEGGQYSPSTELALRLSLLFGVSVNELFMLPDAVAVALSERYHLLRRPASGKREQENGVFEPR